MSRDEAYEILELKKEQMPFDENKVRKAYFRLAQKYHPDKNPDGRDIFEKVNKAYEFLCSAAKLKDGPDPENISLIMRTQIILFKRYTDVLMPYKYAGYPMLISTIKMETNDDQLFSRKDQLLTNLTELAYQTIRCSSLNAEELRREQGLEILNEAFKRCVTMLSQFSKDNDSDMSVQVCLFITLCFSAAAQFEMCREKLFSLSNLVKDMCRCLHFKNLPRLCLTAAEAIGAFAPDDNLQNSLFDCGVVVNLLFYMFSYDFTLEEGGVERSEQQGSNQQEIANNLALGCIKALARLAGFHDGFQRDKVQENDSASINGITLKDKNRVMQALTSLLTPYLARNINGDSKEILKTMNSNSKNPYLIWDNSTRAELRSYLETERECLYKKGEPGDQYLGARFKYSVLEKELTIGDVYVRIYNEVPTYPLENAKNFCIDLLDYIGSHAQYLYSSLMNPLSIKNPIESSASTNKLQSIEIALEALRNVIRHNDGVEIQCIGHFKLLFMLLRLSTSPQLQSLTLEMLISVTANQNCVNDIAASEVLINLLLVLYSFNAGQQLALDCLYALSSHSKIVKDMVTTGGLLYLLNIFANGQLPNIRQKSAELFAKLLTDKLTGPRIRLILQRFLPPLFMDAMKDSAEASVITFEGTHENPELIWNDEARQRVCDAISKMSNSLYSKQSQPDGSETKWNILEDLVEAGVKDVKEATSTLYSSFSSESEIVVSGVFIRLYISNPGWVLRKPKEFLVDLFEIWSDTTNRKQKEGEALEQLTQALVQLFNAQPLLLENIPTMGTLPQVIQSLGSKKDSIVGSALQILNQIVNNENCLKSLSSYECMNTFKEAIQKRLDLVPITAETLSKIFSNQIVVDEFVGQSLRCDLINFLLKLLESNMPNVDRPGSVKAQIANTLKAMLNSMQYLSQVEALLNASRIWRDYKDQKDDMFIMKSNTAGYITGGVPSVAGYLTSGSASMPNNDKLPPPTDNLSD